MPDETQEPVTIPREQWEEMERFRKGETKGDVIVLPEGEPPVEQEE